jgi:hypothetical protein
MRAQLKDPRGVTIALASTFDGNKTHVGVRVGQTGRIAFLCGVYAATQDVMFHHRQQDGQKLEPSCRHCQTRTATLSR